MKLYREGDRSAGICEACRSKVATRMEYRDYTPPGWDETVPDVLVGVCETCGQVVSIPHQSTPRINEYRKVKPGTEFTVTIEARVPREIDEALNLVTVTLGGSSKAIRPAMMRYYFDQLGRKSTVAEAVKKRSADKFKGPADRRVVVKLTHHQKAQVLKVSKAVGMSTSDLIRGIALLAAEDCRIALGGPLAVADKNSRHRRAFLKQLAGSM